MKRSGKTGTLEKIFVEESAQLESRWRRMHFCIMLVMSLVIVAAEAVFSFALYKSSIISGLGMSYVTRYMIIPAIVYAVIDGSAFLMYHFGHPSRKRLNYSVSLCFAALCIAVCFFHDYFVVVYASGVTAIALTTIYADQKLTGITTAFVVAGELALNLFFRWDADTVRDDKYLINVALVMIILLSTYFICFTIVGWEKKRLHAVALRQLELEDLRVTAALDQLTGIRNRLGLRKYIDGTLTVKSYAMIDIDRFKSVNDVWGHAAGDAVLSKLGEILRLTEDATLSAFRYGGDEFLLADTARSEKELLDICRKVNAAFIGSLFESMRAAGVALSFGAASCAGLTPSQAINAADLELYKIKHGC